MIKPFSILFRCLHAFKSTNTFFPWSCLAHLWYQPASSNSMCLQCCQFISVLTFPRLFSHVCLTFSLQPLFLHPAFILVSLSLCLSYLKVFLAVAVTLRTEQGENVKQLCGGFSKLWLNLLIWSVCPKSLKCCWNKWKSLNPPPP